MLLIIHGTDIALSRKYFLEEKQKQQDAFVLDADKVTLTDLAQIFQGGGLFSSTKCLFIEQFLTKRKKSTDFKDILAYLEKNADAHSIFLWEGKELERGSLNALKKANVKAFQLPQTLFQLLDNLKPDNGKLLIKLFHQTIATTETEMVFFMLVRQFRILLALSSDTNNQGAIDELKRMQPWQKSKLKRQAKLFTEEQLKKLYDRLFVIEIGQKTGTLNTSLVSTIDFFLLEV